MAYVPNSGSVVGFQSDATKLVATVSVSGVLQPMSVAALQGTNPWTVQLTSGSVATTVGNSSVMLTSGINTIGSVATLQGTNPWIVQLTSGSVITTGGNSSVMLTPGINTIGSVATLQGTNPWIVQLTSGSVITTGGNSSVMLTQGTNTIGSVAVLQGTSPWIVNMPSPSVIAYQLAGSVMAVNTTVTTGNSSVQLVSGTATIGSVTALQGTNPYVMTGSIQGTMSVLGTVPVTQAGAWTTSIVGTVTALQLAGSIMAVSTTVNTGNSSVQLVNGFTTIGSVGQAGNWIIQPTSVQLIGGTNVIGSVAALQGTNPWIVQLTSGSVITTGGNSSVQVVGTMPTQSVMLVPGIGVLGSVATLQGTNPWVIGNSSVMLTPGINTIGSVATLQGTNPWITTSSGSILGNYGVNSVFANNNTGFADWAVRNDTVASLITTDKTFGPWAVDSAGRGIMKPFAANESSIFGVTSTVNSGDAASVVLVGAAGAGLKNYITDYQVANSGSVSTLIKFTEGGSSLLGVTIAPAGGGSNMPGMAWPISNVVPNQPINLVTGTASSVLYITFRGFKAP